LPPAPTNEFDPDETDPAIDAARIQDMTREQSMIARRASLDPEDGLEI
jgi:hypothetical protein